MERGRRPRTGASLEVRWKSGGLREGLSPRRGRRGRLAGAEMGRSEEGEGASTGSDESRSRPASKFPPSTFPRLRLPSDRNLGSACFSKSSCLRMYMYVSTGVPATLSSREGPWADLANPDYVHFDKLRTRGSNVARGCPPQCRTLQGPPPPHPPGCVHSVHVPSPVFHTLGDWKYFRARTLRRYHLYATEDKFGPFPSSKSTSPGILI